MSDSEFEIKPGARCRYRVGENFYLSAEVVKEDEGRWVLRFSDGTCCDVRPSSIYPPRPRVRLSG